MTDGTEVLYKTTDFWAAASERSIRWDDPDLALPWPKDVLPRLARKDAAAPLLAAADVFA
jgi:dTDP-4-dehydrorhamnose 3,5-epimerase